MAHYENHAPVSNQIGVQNIYGDAIFIDAGVSDNQLRPATNSLHPDELFDNGIIASLAFPQMLDRKNNVETAHPQTCRWLFTLDQYRTWRREPHGFLWIKGKPGSGKSTLMSHLHRTLCLEGQTDLRIEFFFSARGSILQRTFVGMLRSLLIQLFRNDTSSTTRRHLRAAYKEKCSCFGGNTGWEWQLPELKRLFVDTLSSAARQHRMVILIDALDETGGETARDIAVYLHAIYDQIVEAASTIKLCISCRHYPFISNAKAVEIHVENYNHDDIAFYIEDYIENRVRIGNIVVSKGQQDLNATIITLVKMAKGVFQWVCLVMPMVVKWLGEGDTTEQIRVSLSNVPEDLEAVYEHILKDVGADPRYSPKTLRLFQWVLLAQRPLSVIEIRYALSAENIEVGKLHVPMRCHEIRGFEKSSSNMSRRITTWSGGLLEVVSSGHDATDDDARQYWESAYDGMIVQAIHQSVNDFMFARGLSLLWALNNSAGNVSSGFRTSPEAVQWSHAILYLSCLKYLYTEDPEKALAQYTPGRTTYDMRAANIKAQFPFMEYSAHYGLVHAKNSGDYRALDLEDESRLLDKSSSAWAFAYEVLNSQSTYLDWVCIVKYSTVLHFASAANLIALATYRTQVGDDPNERDAFGQTPILVAVAQGHLAVAMILYKSGADVNRESHSGSTPLMLAVSGEHVEMSAFLLSHGADVNARRRGDPVLFTAAEQGNVMLCRLCLEAGADITARGYRGTAIQIAAYRGHEGVIRFLLQAHARVDAQKGLSTAIVLAASNGHDGAIRLLLEAGADINARGRGGLAVRRAAAGGHEGTVRLLLEAGADVNARGKGTITVRRAAERGHEKIVQLLLAAGADVNTQGVQTGKVSAIERAAEGGHEGIVRLLLEAGANINNQGGGDDAIQRAAFRGHEETVRLLLEAGADITNEGRGGKLIRIATLGRHEGIVRFLLEAGAGVNAQREDLDFALKLATSRGNTTMADMLVAAGAENSSDNDEGHGYPFEAVFRIFNT